MALFSRFSHVPLCRASRPTKWLASVVPAITDGAKTAGGSCGSMRGIAKMTKPFCRPERFPISAAGSGHPPAALAATIVPPTERVRCKTGSESTRPFATSPHFGVRRGVCARRDIHMGVASFFAFTGYNQQMRPRPAAGIRNRQAVHTQHASTFPAQRRESTGPGADPCPRTIYSP